MDQVNIAPALPTASRAGVVFSGSRKEFFNLVARGAGLELVTAGFYRFWLATDMRRHLWSHTILDGDGAEYTGRPRELLIGFLIAMAVLAPIYILYFIAGLEAERIQAFASVPLVAFLYVFGQFAIYRARRYRLTRTVWRGVRFWMDGSGWSYALRASLWALLVALTLGLALPWREAALERYKMRHSHYGNLQGSFEGTGLAFFKQGWWLWPLAWLSLSLPIAIPFVYAAFKALHWRWWLSGLRVGGVRLDSTLGYRDLVGLYWKTIGWFVLILIAFVAVLIALAFAAASATGQSFGDMLVEPDLVATLPFLVVLAAAYLAFALSLNVVLRVYLLRDLWARVAASVAVTGIEHAADVAGRGDLATALGEGFADGLDVAGL